MKVSVDLQTSQHASASVSAVCQSPDGEIFSASDDKIIWRWGPDSGESRGQLCTINSYVTDMKWIPTTGQQTVEIFVVACTDGTFRLIGKSGREERSVKAVEKGAITCLQWSHDGSALVTAGEDGSVKIWSRSGNLRSTLAQTGNPVYTVAWAPDSESVLFSNSNELIIKSVQPGKKQLQWKAHNGVVLHADWSAVTTKIISGGEERIVKIWDSLGRLLYRSQAFPHVITAVAWNPLGDMYAVGAYNLLRICDQTGWTHCKATPPSGSIANISWRPGGMDLHAAAGGGAVVHATLTDVTKSWKDWNVTVKGPHHVQVCDATTDTVEELDFPKERITTISLAYERLIVVTSAQCFIYPLNQLNVPNVFDRKTPVNFLIQSPELFLIADRQNGLQIYNYDGRLVSSPRVPGLQVDLLDPLCISLSGNTLAIVDQHDRKVIRLFQVNTGRALQSFVSHHHEVVELELSPDNGMRDADGSHKSRPSSSSSHPSKDASAVCFVDRNGDLFISLTNTAEVVKLHTQVDCFRWCDVANILVAFADGKFVIWIHPTIAFTDKDLLSPTTIITSVSCGGKGTRIVSFNGFHVTARKIEGGLFHVPIPHYIVILHHLVNANSWESAVKLCRFVAKSEIWAALAGMAIAGRDISTAEIAFAQLKDVHKLHYIQYIKNIPTVAGRNAELALYMRNVDEAERILLQAQPPLVYRAIKLNIRLFRWVRALEVAIKYKTHIDTVLAYRQAYLEQYGVTEANPTFQKYQGQVEVNLDTIALKKQQERENEEARASRQGLAP